MLLGPPEHYGGYGLLEPKLNKQIIASKRMPEQTWGMSRRLAHLRQENKRFALGHISEGARS